MAIIAPQWSFFGQALQQIQEVEEAFSRQPGDIQKQKLMYESVLDIVRECRQAQPKETQEIGQIAAQILLCVAKLSVPEKEGILHFVFPLIFSERDSDFQSFKATHEVLDKGSEEQVKPLRDWFNQICYDAKKKLIDEKDYQYHVALKVNLAAQILRFMREDDVRTQFIMDLFYRACPIYHETALRTLLKNLPNIPEMESLRNKFTECEKMTCEVMKFSPITDRTHINDFIALLEAVRISSESFHQVQKMQVSQIVRSIVKKSSCKEDLFSLVQEVFPQLEEIYRSHWAIWHVKQGNLTEGIRRFFFVQDSDHQEEFCHALLEFASSRERLQEEIERALSTACSMAERMQNEALHERVCMAYLDHGMVQKAFVKWTGDRNRFFLACVDKHRNTVDLEKRKQFAAELYNVIFGQRLGKTISPDVHFHLVETFGLSLEKRIEYFADLIQQYPQDQKYRDVLLALDVMQMQKNCVDTMPRNVQDALQDLFQIESEPSGSQKEEKVCNICCAFCPILTEDNRSDIDKEMVAAWIESACEHLPPTHEMKSLFLSVLTVHKKGLIAASLRAKGILKGTRSTPLPGGTEIFPSELQKVLNALREMEGWSSPQDKDALACEACFQLFAFLAEEKQPNKVKTQARGWLAWAHRHLSDSHEMKMVIKEQMNECDRVGFAGIEEAPQDHQLYLQCAALLQGFDQLRTPEEKQQAIDQIKEYERKIQEPELKKVLLLKLMDLQVAQLGGHTPPQPDQATMIDACFRALDCLQSKVASSEEKQRATDTIIKMIRKIQDSDIARMIRETYNALMDSSNRGNSPPPAPQDKPLEGGKQAPPILEPGLEELEKWIHGRSHDQK